MCNGWRQTRVERSSHSGSMTVSENIEIFTKRARARDRSKWLTNGRPTNCFGCGQPFPHCEDRAEAQVGADGKLYCYGTACDARLAGWRVRKRA